MGDWDEPMRLWKIFQQRMAAERAHLWPDQDLDLAAKIVRENFLTSQLYGWMARLADDQVRELERWWSL